MNIGPCFYHCDLCDVDICGQLQWQQHLIGSKHLKKMVQNGKISVFDGKLTMTGLENIQPLASPLKKQCQNEGESTIEEPYKCNVCQVSMTGPEPYAQHMASAKHLKKAQSGSVSSTPSAVVRLMNSTTTEALDDEKDAEYRAKYLKDMIVIESDQKIEDVFHKHFAANRPTNAITTEELDDEKDAEYRAKYLKEMIVIESDQKIEDVFRKHFV